MDNELTVILTASYIPSHPKILLIREIIESLKLIEYKNSTVFDKCKIILAHDHNNNKNYKKYIKNLKIYLNSLNNENLIFKLRNNHGHLTGNIRNVINDVKTEYLLVIQHDLPFIRGFNIEKIISDMRENLFMKHIKFNKRVNKRKKMDAKNNLFGKQIIGKNYIYTRTPGWSDQNHICKKSYYTEIVLKECKDGQFMETTLDNNLNVNNHNKYGTFIFGKLGEKAYINHRKGRTRTYSQYD